MSPMDSSHHHPAACAARPASAVPALSAADAAARGVSSAKRLGPRDGPAIDEARIDETLRRAARADGAAVREIIARGRLGHGLGLEEVAVLATSTDGAFDQELFEAARAVKLGIYGRRVVLFAPLYVSNHCSNECAYCAFRARHRSVERRRLDRAGIEAEVGALLEQGHKRLLLVAGESSAKGSLERLAAAIETAYGVRRARDRIRRINVNVAPLDEAGFRQLKSCSIGTYQLFQETYHRPTYGRVHLAGPKADYDWRLGAMDRAMRAGIDDVGLGALFGLYDWRFELLALFEHAAHLEARFGAGPHTVSVPRLEPAGGSALASRPPHAVSDHDFRKLVAIIRLALPYTGIILSTREAPAMRREALALGVSQISAGSRTSPGGYREDERGAAARGEQFSLGDHRSLDEVVRELADAGYVPSFCTACYRRGRTGADFMDLAKPGAIRLHCDPNGIATFLEYLLDHASSETRSVGLALVERLVADGTGAARERTERLVRAVRNGKRDVLV